MADINIEVNDNLSFSDDFNLTTSYAIVVNDVFIVEDEQKVSKTIQLSIDEKFSLVDLGSMNINYSIIANDELKLTEEVKTQLTKNNKIQYNTDTWVLNFDTYAFSRYDNFYFNSYAQLDKDILIGTNDNGLFLINDKIKNDDGDFIKSKIVTKEYVFSDTLSYVRDAMIYHKGDGELFLNIKCDNGFNETYMMMGDSRENITRLKLNKGNKSLKWQFSLVSDLGEIDLNKMVVYPLLSTRFRGV